VRKVITEYTGNQIYKNRNDLIESYVDLSYSRAGQDVRYALNDDKLRNLGWEPKVVFDDVIKSITNYYKKGFIW